MTRPVINSTLPSPDVTTGASSPATQRNSESGCPQVSICSITYNHAKFIARALDGFLMQETAFPVEIIVHDDCSTDGTAQIIASYQSRYPGRITAILQSENQRSQGRHVLPLVLGRARGQYIAVCEGDDYWTHPQKLQRQVDWLESHPNSPLCFHNVEVWDERITASRGALCPPSQPPFLSLETILTGNPIATCSAVFRRGYLPAMPPAMSRLPMGDWPRWILLLRHGPAGYLDGLWGCYRVHGAGVWSAQAGSQQMRQALRVFAPVSQMLGPAYKQAIQAGKKAILARLISELVFEGRWREASIPAWRYLLTPPRPLRAPAGKATLYLRLILRLPSRGMLPRNTPTSS